MHLLHERTARLLLTVCAGMAGGLAAAARRRATAAAGGPGGLPADGGRRRPVAPEVADRRALARAERIAAALGDALPAARAGRLSDPPLSDDPPPPRWSVHSCLLDRTCRSFGAPGRLHVNVPAGHLTVAPGRAALGDGRGWRRWLHWRWADRRACRNLVRTTTAAGLLTGFRLCPRRAGHRGPCLDPDTGARVDRPVLG